MSSSSIFADWRPEYTRQWNRQPLAIAHHMHLDPLFGLDALAELIDRCPRSGYALVHTGHHPDGTPRWREGEFTGVPGQRVIATIARGSMWLNLRDVGQHSPAYIALMRAAYDELSARLPGFEPQALKMGILISSPSAQVHYHCDLPGQTLWQIHGRKRVWVYPSCAPFVRPQALEDIAYSGHEFKLGYADAFDAAAETFELEPGTMLSWPLNAPHRIENHDCLNVSVTTEHWTAANRRSQKVLLANGVLRHRLHWAVASQATQGPSFWMKSLLQAGWRRSAWATRVQDAHRPVEFRLDPGASGGLVELGGAAR